MVVRLQRTISASYLRNFIFGVEDSIVSTVGLLSGVAIAGLPRQTILLTGVVLIFVEAFSMAVGSFLSESSAERYMRRSEATDHQPFWNGVVMFFSYLLSGFIPLAPYVIAPPAQAFWYSIACSLVALFALGVIGARISGVSIPRGGTRMAVIGGIAIGVGVIAGLLLTKLQISRHSPSTMILRR